MSSCIHISKPQNGCFAGTLSLQAYSEPRPGGDFKPERPGQGIKRTCETYCTATMVVGSINKKIINTHTYVRISILCANIRSQSTHRSWAHGDIFTVDDGRCMSLAKLTKRTSVTQVSRGFPSHPLHTTATARRGQRLMLLLLLLVRGKYHYTTSSQRDA